MASPTKAAPASSRHHGARAPSSHGVATTPRAPTGLPAASSASSSEVRPVSRPSQATNDPAADRPPSSSQPATAPRDTTRPAGASAGRVPTGTDRLAVVPQLTMGRDPVAPVPTTSHGRSPAPMITGVPARRPSSAEAAPVSPPVTRSDGTTGASRAPAGAASSSTTPPSKS